MVGTSSGRQRLVPGRQQEFPFQPKQRRARVRGLGVFLGSAKTQHASRQPEFPAVTRNPSTSIERPTPVNSPNPIVTKTPAPSREGRPLFQSTASVYRRPTRRKQLPESSPEPVKPVSRSNGGLRLIMLLADLSLLFGGVYLVSNSPEPVPALTLGMAVMAVVVGGALGIWALLHESN